MSEPGFLVIPITAVTAETETAVTIDLGVPPALTELFRYRPGQFVTVRTVVNGRTCQRCYSLCSAPDVDEAPQIAVKRVDGGQVSNALCDAKVGQSLLVRPPAGRFTPGALDQDFLLVAGGSGITPILSIAKAALAGGKGRVRLLYANRDENAVMFKQPLMDLAAGRPGRLTVVHWLERVQGLPTAETLAALVEAWPASEAFICGPEPFMAAAADALRLAGTVEGRVHVERFGSLPDEDPDPSPAGSTRAGDAEIEVLMDGQMHRARWPHQAKLLDALLEAGVKAPHACRVGGCSACMCRLTEGKVRMAANRVLNEQDLAEGWVLACQAYADSERVRIEIP